MVAGVAMGEWGKHGDIGQRVQRCSYYVGRVSREISYIDMMTIVSKTSLQTGNMLREWISGALILYNIMVTM